MQWTSERHGGFSRAKHVVRPVINDKVYGYERVNVADERRDPDSLLNWTERMIRTRKECPEISWGRYEVLRTNAADVLVLRYDWRGTSLVTLTNFSSARRRVRVRVGSDRDGRLVSLFDDRVSHVRNDGTHVMTLDPYGWRWCRVGGADNVLARDAIASASPMESD